MVTEYKQGDKVKIVRGVYKHYKHGEYVKAKGTKMATIQLSGAGGKSFKKDVWRTSIERIQSSTKQNEGRSNKKEDDTIVVSRKKYNSMKRDFDLLTVAMQKLRLKIDNMDKSTNG
jgi:hypothetical protein